MKWLLILIIIALSVSQVFVFFQWKETSNQLLSMEKELASTASKLKKQERYTKGNLEKLGQTVSIVASRRLAGPAVPNQSVSKQAIAELLMIESFRLDRLVEWVDLIEDKMYFILFPSETGDREQASVALQTRTRDIRAQFAQAAQKSVTLRQKLITQSEQNPASR